MERLIAASADGNSRNEDAETPLHVAMEKGHGELIASLLGKGADVKLRTANGETVLHAVALNGDQRLLTLLLDLPVAVPLEWLDRYHLDS